MTPTAITREQALALAYASLLDHVQRRDAGHALARLLRSLAAATGAPCRLVPLPGSGLSPVDVGRPGIVQGPTADWPLTHIGTPIGTLQLPTPADLAPAEWRSRLEPVLETAAALLADLATPNDPARTASFAMMRAAMHEAGTFTWEWDIASDVLGDIDEGELMLGYPSNTLGHTQQDWNHLIHPDDVDAVEAAYQAHARGELSLYRSLYRARAHDGQWRWIEERGRIVERDEHGQPRRMFGTQSDATLLRELEHAQRERLAAEAASAAKTLFLSRVSHELRTPLNAVIGFAQLLESDPLLIEHPPQRRQVQLIQEAGVHLMAMIADLLDLSLAETSHLPIALQDVALVPLLEGCADWIRPQAELAQVRIMLLLPPSAQVRADPIRLRQVLMNLLANGVKYNRAGGHVSLRAVAEGSQWRIDVEDTGEGIPAAQRPGLFQPFNRLGRETGGVSGTGIGLALSQSLAQLMNSTITVQSTVGVGTVFSLRLPAA